MGYNIIACFVEILEFIYEINIIYVVLKFNKMLELLGGASVGLHTMTVEDFGIIVGEYMAAKVVSIGKDIIVFI